MLKKFLLTTYLLTLTTTPVHAVPTWAKAIAVSHCDYLEQGLEWSPAFRLAIRENFQFGDLSQRVWEIDQDFWAETVMEAIDARCYVESTEAFKRQQTQPVYRNEFNL